MTKEELELRFNALGKLLGTDEWQKLKEVLTENEVSDTLALLQVGIRSFPDDYYRGRIAVRKWLRLGLEKEIAEFFEAQRLAQEEGSQPSLDVGHPYAEDNPPDE